MVARSTTVYIWQGQGGGGGAGVCFLLLPSQKSATSLSGSLDSFRIGDTPALQLLCHNGQSVIRGGDHRNTACRPPSLPTSIVLRSAQEGGGGVAKTHLPSNCGGVLGKGGYRDDPGPPSPGFPTAVSPREAILHIHQHCLCSPPCAFAPAKNKTKKVPQHRPKTKQTRRQNQNQKKSFLPFGQCGILRAKSCNSGTRQNQFGGPEGSASGRNQTPTAKIFVPVLVSLASLRN